MDSWLDGSQQPQLVPMLLLDRHPLLPSPLVQESTQHPLRLVHDAAFETALKGQFDEDRETVESILQSALNILEGNPVTTQAGLAGNR